MSNWIRVSHRNKCPVCGRGDWCALTGDGKQVKCMRVESDTMTKDGGWLHPVGEQVTNRVQRFARAPVARHWADCDSMLREWRSKQAGELQAFAATLDVSQAALKELDCVYAPEHRAFAFPMRDEQRKVVGIRLRNHVGRKWAVEGSKHGLFFPKTLRRDILLIVEGPTDSATAIDFECDVIGRPMNLGSEAMIRHVASLKIATHTFIIQEHDSKWIETPDGQRRFIEPGKRGAERLQEYMPRAKIVTLPAKDLRAYKQMGATAATLRQYLQCQ